MHFIGCTHDGASHLSAGGLNKSNSLLEYFIILSLFCKRDYLFQTLVLGGFHASEESDQSIIGALGVEVTHISFGSGDGVAVERY